MGGGDDNLTNEIIPLIHTRPTSLCGFVVALFFWSQFLSATVE